MSLVDNRTGLVEAFRTADSLSQAVIVSAMLFVVWAYLPTLLHDYVTQDQWRAFRYSIEPQSAIDRALACTKLTTEFYALTGRPLVWISECIEHAAVAKISDFAHLRPIVLALVLSTIAYLGYVLAPILGGLAIGVLAAAALSLTPAYSFMYLQGMTAGMVLITPLLAAASFNCYSKRNLEPGKRLSKLITAFCLFIVACLNYPAYAFIVLPLALLKFGLDVSTPLRTRLEELVSTLIFYFCASLAYYVLVKAMVAVISLNVTQLPNMGEYEVTMQLSRAALLRRLGDALFYFLHMRPFAFVPWKGLSFVILAAFAGFIGWLASAARPLSSFAMISLNFAIATIILVGSISPWLFSKATDVSSRHVLVWNLFFCAATVGFFSVALQRHRLSAGVAATILLVAGLLPMAWIQYRQSKVEIALTGAEVRLMRESLSRWLDTRGWIDNRYLLVVRPHRTETRPPEFAALVEPKYGNDNAVLASAINPVSIPWMITAILRERTNHPIFEMDDCREDQACSISGLLNTREIVVQYLVGDGAFTTTVKPFVINLTVLTDHPRVLLEKFIDISASSVLETYGPRGLLFSADPGWHAARNPVYPQSITLDFGQSRSFGKLSLRSQDGLAQRMPKQVRIKTSNDKAEWTTVASSDDVCTRDDPSRWSDVVIPSPVQARFLQVEILSNCGDPDLLTLKGLKVE